MLNWSVYMIRASDESLYTGISTNVVRRFKEHREGRRGAKYFRGRIPLEVVYEEAGHSRRSASRREAEIKSWSVEKKRQLIVGSE